MARYPLSDGIIIAVGIEASVFPCVFFFRMGSLIQFFLSKKIPRRNACMPRATYLGVFLGCQFYGMPIQTDYVAHFSPFTIQKFFYSGTYLLLFGEGFQPLSFGIRVTH